MYHSQLECLRYQKERRPYDCVTPCQDFDNYTFELFTSFLDEIEERSTKLLNDHKELALSLYEELKKKPILTHLEVQEIINRTIKKE